MTYDPPKHHRRSIRLKGFDYATPGAYFVTICTHERVCILGHTESDVMVLSEYGQLVERCWHLLPHHFLNVQLDVFVVMPNHMHGVIVAIECRYDRIKPACVGAGSPRPYVSNPTKPTLGQMVAYFKYQSTKAINRMRATPGVPVWQRNYYEHIIRNEDELNHIRDYIR
jgi:REP element-mobilizing transposase RayT